MKPATRPSASPEPDVLMKDVQCGDRNNEQDLFHCGGPESSKSSLASVKLFISHNIKGRQYDFFNHLRPLR